MKKSIFVPRLPVCPHCRTIYRYGEVFNAVFERKITCYRCEREFFASGKRIFLLVAAVLILIAAVNAVCLAFVKGLSFWALLAINFALISAAAAAVPFFIGFEKDKKN